MCLQSVNSYYTMYIYIINRIYSYDLVYKKMKYSKFYIYLSNVAYDFSVDDVGMTMFRFFVLWLELVYW